MKSSKRRPSAVPTSWSRSGRLLLLATLSGGIALGYEVLWARMLALHVGQDIGALVAVSSGFLAGLAAGSQGWRRLAGALTPLAAYARLEVFVALAALLFPAALGALAATLHGAIGMGLPASWAGWSFIGLGAILVFFATIPMGATIPALARAQGASVGFDRLYGANCAGAAMGALFVTFIILPGLGHTGTGLLLAMGNGALAVFAWSQSGGRGVDAEARATEAPATDLRPFIKVAALGGAISMASQILWTRALILVIGGSTYAMSLILAAFIGCLGVGSWLSTRRVFTAWRDAIGLSVAGMSLASLAGLVTLHLVPTVCVPAFDGRSIFDPVRLGCCLLMAVVSVGPVALFSGALLPLAVRACPGAATAGRLLAANTTGAVAGQLAILLALPVLGLRGSFDLVGFLGLVTFLWWTWRQARAFVPDVVTVLAAALAWYVPRPESAILHSAPYMSASDYVAAAREKSVSITSVVRAQGRIVMEKAGAFAMVAVRESAEGHRSLLINGKPDASSSLDMKAQRLMAHLPMAFRPGARDVLTIGYGSGVTAGSFLAHPISSLTVAEISPEVIAAGPYFRRYNRAPLADSRTRLEIGDARSLLACSSHRYDVISSEPTNPWVAGVAPLFTKEFFQIMRDHLTTHGVAAQWVQGYWIRPEDFRSILETFRSVFPRAWLFRAFDGADYLLVGCNGPFEPELSKLERIFQNPQVRKDLADVDVFDGMDLAAHLLAGPVDLESFSQGAQVQCDDRLSLEFTGPAALGVAPSIWVDTSADRPLPGAMFLKGPGVGIEASKVLDSRVWRYRAFSHLQAGRSEKFFTAMETSMRLATETKCDLKHLRSLHLAILHRYQEMGELERAETALKAFIEDDPVTSLYRTELATLLIRRQKIQDGVALLQQVLTAEPTNVQALLGLASVDEVAGRTHEALVKSLKLADLEPHEASHEIAVARLLDSLGQRSEACEHIVRARALDPSLGTR